MKTPSATTLSAADLVSLEKESWIDQATADAWGLSRVSSIEGAQLVGRSDRSDYSGLAFPVYWPGDDRPKELFLRRDHPDYESHNGILKPKQKYLAPPGRGNLLIFGPSESIESLADTTIPILLVEGLKKTVATWRLSRWESDTPRFLVCGLTGVWNFRGTIGKTTDASGARVDVRGPIPSLDKLAWDGRETTILFDSDTASNPSVYAARSALAANLRKRGARVALLDLPPLDGLDKIGVDDLLANWGPERVIDWLTTAAPAALSEDDAELARLASLPPLEYGKARKAAAERWGVPVSCVDEAVTTKRKEREGKDAGPILETIEAAESSVDGAALADEIVRILRRFIILDDHGAHAVVLWLFWSHGFELWSIAPILAFLSPEKRCGKTSLLSLLTNLLDRALLTSNTSSAALFRIIEASKPTLLVDEIDSFLEADEALRGILNSGHTKAAAKVIRVHGEQLEVKVFSTWCPKILAAIGVLPDTIMDRAVVIRMKRKTKQEAVEPLRWVGKNGTQLRADLKRLAAQCKRWVLDHADTLTAATPALPDILNDRQADNWHPLLVIATILGGAWPKRATEAAISLSGNDLLDAESVKAQLLQDVHALVTAMTGTNNIWSQDLCDQLVLMEERPWAEWRHGKPMTANQLARQLRPFGVQSRAIRRGDDVKKGYEFADLADCFARYISPPAQETHVSNRYSVTTLVQSGDDPLLRSVTAGECNGTEKGLNPKPTAGCNAVTVQNREISAGETIELFPEVSEEVFNDAD